jgi:hypothetical protein
MTARKPKKPQPDIFDIVVTEYVEQGDDHAEITLTPAPTLWAAADAAGKKAFGNVDEELALSAQHHLAGLLARLALLATWEVDLEHVLHGCHRGTFYAQAAGRPPRPLVAGGDPLAADETLCRAVEGCHITVDDLGAPFDFAMYVQVPRQRLAAWKKRLNEMLEALLAGVPQ